MNVNDFFKYAVHLGNFSQDQLNQLFDWDEIEALPDGTNPQKSVYALGQFLVGNRIDPTTTYLALDSSDMGDFLDTWFCVVKDPHTLRMIGRYITHSLI